MCKQCSPEAQERHREYLRRWSRENVVLRRQLNRSYRERNALGLAARYIQRKLDLISFLGGECARCGFSDPRALHIGHKVGLCETKERRIVTHNLRNQILTGKEPKDKYQLLCANCNTIQMFERKEFRGRPLAPAPAFHAS